MTTDETTVDTTETETTETETTETAPTQRSVSELLRLKTYQGMTDAEIESLIEFYKDYARKDEIVKSEQVAQIQQMNEWCAYYERAEAETNDILKKILAAPLELATIDIETDSGEVDNE